MKKKTTIISILVLSVIVVVETFALVNIQQNNNNAIATLDDEIITQKQLTNQLDSKEKKRLADKLINDKIIDLEIDTLNLKSTSEEEMLKQLPYIQLFDSSKKTLADEQTKEFVKEYIHVKELAKKYTLNDEKFKKFIEDERNFNGDYLIKVQEISGNHQQLSKIEDSLKQAKDINSIIKNNSLDIKEKNIFSLTNEYNQDFSQSKVGDYLHVMDEHHGSGHKIIIVTNINKSDETIFNLKENKEEILNVYMSKNYFQERLDVLNVLKMKHKIKYAIKE